MDSGEGNQFKYVTCAIIFLVNEFKKITYTISFIWYTTN